jgi:hypothetical protein
MTRSRTALVLVAALALAAACTTTKKTTTPTTDPVYQTYGVHNPPEVSPCQFPNCVYTRGPGEPPDPSYPEYWQSPWTMYRVYNGYVENSPPYDGKPPAPMKEGVDYEVSYGASYYDSRTAESTAKARCRSITTSAACRSSRSTTSSPARSSRWATSRTS